MMPGGDRPNYVLFLTDGLPTVGTTETAEILKNVAAGQRPRAPDLRLRRRPRRQHRAPGQDLLGQPGDVGLRRRGRGPRGRPVELLREDLLAASRRPRPSSSRGSRPSQVYPRVLPDLFKGSQLVLVGRYRGRGPVTVVLTGKSGREDETLRPRKPDPRTGATGRASCPGSGRRGASAICSRRSASRDRTKSSSTRSGVSA